MITISLCMIVKNEEKTLSRCLDSIVDLVDEINIVDTGSTDETKAIAARYTDRIYDFEWINDFSAARNESFSKATQQFILWLDADDYLLPEDREAFRKLKEEMDAAAFDMVTMNYNLTLDPQGRPMSRIRRERLVKRALDFRWYDPIHEYMAFQGTILKSDIAITHGRMHEEKTRNLSYYERMLEQGQAFTPRDHLNYGNELLYNERYAESIFSYETFLLETKSSFQNNDNTTLREDNLLACKRLAFCYSLLGDKEKELDTLIMAMRYDIPQAEICCRLGLWFDQENMLHTAIRWFELALKDEQTEEIWGQVSLPIYTWLPHQQLTLLYGKIGRMDKAYYHNEIVLSYMPDDPNILSNKHLLETALAAQASNEEEAQS